jgi:hypothetical protein
MSGISTSKKVCKSSLIGSDFGAELKPESDENYYFFEAVRELVDADLTYYGHLQAAYIENDFPRLAWACRGLLGLVVIVKWVLISGKNANRFAEDRLMTVNTSLRI